MYNPILHVLPLTSTNDIHNIELGILLYNEDEIKKLQKLYDETDDNNTKKEINKCLKYYTKSQNRISYGCIKHIKTISKLSIIRSINKYDYLDNLKVSSNILELIDKELVKEYTDISNI